MKASPSRVHLSARRCGAETHCYSLTSSKPCSAQQNPSLCRSLNCTSRSGRSEPTWTRNDDSCTGLLLHLQLLHWWSPSQVSRGHWRIHSSPDYSLKYSTVLDLCDLNDCPCSAWLSGCCWAAKFGGHSPHTTAGQDSKNSY